MPALGMSQETGILVSWLKKEGDIVHKGEPIMEVETDKATLEIEASDSGTLTGISAQPGDTIPVGRTIAWILGNGEALPETHIASSHPLESGDKKEKTPINASPVARKMAQELGIDLENLGTGSRRIEKSDVLAYLETQQPVIEIPLQGIKTRLTPASPKARLLASKMNLNITDLVGSGPGGAVLEADVLKSKTLTEFESALKVSNTWAVMAQRVTQSWNSAPHIYLQREVNAGRLVSWRNAAQEQTGLKLTYTDLLVKLVAVSLVEHPRVNAYVRESQIFIQNEINLGLAVATSTGLVVPVVHQADTLTLDQIATRNRDLVARAQLGKLHPDDLQGGTFTLSNLGMYGVDVFCAVINPPQAAILAVGRIAERVVPINGVPAVQQMMTLSLSCDHRALDGALGARFLDYLAKMIEEPIILLK